MKQQWPFTIVRDDTLWRRDPFFSKFVKSLLAYTYCTSFRVAREKIAQFHQDYTRFVRIKLFTFLNRIFLPKKVMNGLLRYGVQWKCIEACGWTCLLNKETDVSQNHSKTNIQITCPQLGNEKWIAQQKKISRMNLMKFLEYYYASFYFTRIFQCFIRRYGRIA